MNDKALLGDLANWPTEVGPLDAKRTLAGVKEKALLVALGDTVTEYQADTLIERIFKVKAEELVDALANMLGKLDRHDKVVETETLSDTLIKKKGRRTSRCSI